MTEKGVMLWRAIVAGLLVLLAGLQGVTLERQDDVVRLCAVVLAEHNGSSFNSSVGSVVRSPSASRPE